MINTLTRAATLGALMAAAIFATRSRLVAGAEPGATRRHQVAMPLRLYGALLQRSAGRRRASLQCLQKNMSSLSAGCQGAVRAVQPPAAPKAETAPRRRPKESAPAAARTEPAPAATTAAKPAARQRRQSRSDSAPAQQPSSAQISAIRSACRSDYPKVCAGVPTGGAPALQCLEKNKAKLSAACEKAVARPPVALPRRRQVAQPPRRPAATAAAAAPAVSCCARCGRAKSCWYCGRPAVPMSARSAAPLRPAAAASCSAWRRNAASLSPACKDVLAQFAAQ